MSGLVSRARRGEVVRLLAAALAVLAVSGCATPPKDPAALQAYRQADDPLEPTNRYIHNVNMAIDDMALKPISTIYVGAVPAPYVAGIRNLLNNWRMPATILNSALQGDWNNMMDAFMSFFINTTAGMGGLFDIPGSFGKAPREEDFGQTLGVWGVGQGPALTLPLIGPSNVRDAVGIAVDTLTDPLTYVLSPAWSYARDGMTIIQTRADIGPDYDQLRRTSIDFYAALRSLYRQHREAQIRNSRGEASSGDLFGPLGGGSTTGQ